MKGAKPAKAKADSKLSVKRKVADRPAKPAKKAKAAKDPNKPKRPPSAFFVFMEEFRKTFKEKNPNNKSVAVVGKAGGDKWKTLSEAEKAPYVAKAEKRKLEYNKVMAAYNKKKDAPAKAAPAPAPADEDDEDDEGDDHSEDEDEDDEDDDE